MRVRQRIRAVTVASHFSSSVLRIPRLSLYALEHVGCLCDLTLESIQPQSSSLVRQSLRNGALTVMNPLVSRLRLSI